MEFEKQPLVFIKPDWSSAGSSPLTFAWVAGSKRVIKASMPNRVDRQRASPLKTDGLLEVANLTSLVKNRCHEAEGPNMTHVIGAAHECVNSIGSEKDDKVAVVNGMG